MTTQLSPGDRVAYTLKESDACLVLDQDQVAAMSTDEFAAYWQAIGVQLRTKAQVRARLEESRRRSEAHMNRRKQPGLAPPILTGSLDPEDLNS